MKDMLPVLFACVFFICGIFMGLYISSNPHQYFSAGFLSGISASPLKMPATLKAGKKYAILFRLSEDASLGEIQNNELYEIYEVGEK